MMYNEVITKQVVNQARMITENTHDVPAGGLEYIGFTDCTMLQPGWYQLQFNVITHDHPTVPYGGTVGYNFGKSETEVTP